ncbi:MAG: GH1 family beta-glucosidase [Spirochaetaceae bacterium]|nr:GH1 family beta-glucosidase [Spirochaetaceae bacterium]
MHDQFPPGFLWGTATASYQIEGATAADGRGQSIWDRFAAMSGKVAGGATGDPACDSYYRYRDDIAIMKAMNNNAYRFSIAWPRVVPDGGGTVNGTGLDYYDRLVDALGDAGIVPLVTLYHWDLPQALQDDGGWASRNTIDAFAWYTEAVTARLGDRVKMWATFNEPWCVSMLGNELGQHAPGLQDRAVALQVAHNVLVAHGTAMPIIRAHSSNCKAGIVLNMTPAYPAQETEADLRRAALANATHNEWFLDPVMGRPYPQIAWDHYGADVPEIAAGDMGTIHQPVDYFALNYYTRQVVHDPAGGDGKPLHRRDDANVSDRDWEIFPAGLTDLLTRLYHRHPHIPEWYVTENGMSLPDRLVDGRVRDPRRIAYLHGHFAAVLDLLKAGVPMKGYFVWSLMDNFEWAFGYDSRFGLAYVDFRTQERTLKDSGLWYGRVAAENRLVAP